MSRYLAIIDTFKLNQLRSLGEIYVSPRELNEINSADPHTANYQDLLEENFFFKNVTDKVFLLISLLEERDDDRGLDVCISEIEYIIALNFRAGEQLKKRFPEFRFYSLTGYQGIFQNFNSYNVRKNSAAGIAAMRVLMGLCDLPPTINSYNLLDLSTDPPRELLVANHLIKKKIPYFRTNLIYRTLLTLITMYRRTRNYPDGDIGYVMDMLEIYHYAVNRSDQRPPEYNNEWRKIPVYATLLKIHEENPDISLNDVLVRIEKLDEYEKFLHTLATLYSKNYSILFIYLKSISELKRFGISRSVVSKVASECNNTDERELLATWLGCCFGYLRIIPAVFDTMELNIMSGGRDDSQELPDNDDGLITSFGTSGTKNRTSNGRSPDSDVIASDMPAANDEHHGTENLPDTSLPLKKALMNLTDSSPVTPLASDLLKTSCESRDTGVTNQEKAVSDGSSESAAGQDTESDIVIDLSKVSTVNDDNAGDPQMYLSKDDLENISFTEPGDDASIGISGILPEGFLEFSFYSEDTGAFLNLAEAPENRNFEVIELFANDGKTPKSEEKPEKSRPEYDSDTAVYAKGVRINHSQLKIAAYTPAFLEGVFQALAITPDFTALSIQEISCAVNMLIRTEAPVSKECILRRFAHICKQTGTSFKNEHRLKVLQEINHVIEKNRLITDIEDFIYIPHRPVYSRNRKLCGDRDSARFCPREIRYSSYVSRQEIIATIRLIKNNDNLGLGGIKPSAEDILRFMGLLKNKTRSISLRETDRLNRIISEDEIKNSAAESA